MKYSKLFLSVICVSLFAVSCSGPLGTQSVGAGVAKTTNGGTDWVLSNKVITTKTSGKKTTTQTSNALADVDVQSLRFDPSSTAKIFAATTAGLYYTEDSADTWGQILGKVNVYDVAIDPTNSDHVYATGIVSGSGKVLESTDKGKSWQEIYNEVSPQNPVIGIAINPSNSKEMVIALLSGNLVYSIDSGKSWSLMQNFQNQITQISWQSGAIYVLCKTRGLFKKVDGSDKFVSISDYLLNLSQSQLKKVTDAVRSSSENNTSQKLESVSKFNYFTVGKSTPGLVYITADNGLFKSVNEGQDWTYVSLPLKISSDNTVQIEGVSFGDSDSVVFASAGNTVYKSLNSGQSWQVQSIATTSKIQYILVDYKAGQTAYVGLNGGHK